MTETEKLLLKCIEALVSMVTDVAVVVDANDGKGLDGDAYYRAYGKYNAAHQDLIRLRRDDK